MAKKKQIRHREYGLLTNHHLVPRSRIRQYYGASFTLPNNLMKLWRLRHDSWHVLFRNKTLNETIAYLETKKSRAYAYQKTAWKTLFKEKSWHEVVQLLRRAQRMIRKEHSTLELCIKLRKDIGELFDHHQKIDPVITTIHKRFKPRRKPYLKAA